MKERVVRLFISSTFLDMNDERDHLNNYIFPQIKEYCKSRYINFIPIDLRWGITEEDSKNAMVLASCMEEVDNSRPFFVGMLGMRYGWMPSEKELECSRPSIEKNKAWLQSMITQSASITEIEMEYAALNDFSIPHALFFIKKDGVDLPVEFCEAKESLANEKLKTLKKKIRSQKKYPVYEYETTNQLGDTLYEELITMIEKEYPVEERDYESSIITRHEVSLERHAFTLFDVPTTEQDMKQWGDNGYRYLVFTGPSGSGTSNAMALAVQYMRKQYRLNKVIYYDFECADPTKDLIDDFLFFMSLDENDFPHDKWAMIAIDNASLLDGEQTERMLHWLHNDKPENLHPVFAASYSVFTETMRFQNCDTFTLHGMTHQMQYTFIKNFCKIYGKALTVEQQDKIVAGKHSNDPTILTIVLNTLVNFGSMEKLQERIDALIYEADYSIFSGLMIEAENIFHKINLYQEFVHAITAIAMYGNVGISEENLLKILNMPMAKWTIIRPMILQFCHSNTIRISYRQYIFNQDVKNHYNTTWIANLGCQMIEWWVINSQNLKEASMAIASIYSYNWHLPYDNEKGVLLHRRMLSIMLSPETVLYLPTSTISALWSFYFGKGHHLYENPPELMGRPIAELPREKQITFYKKIIALAEGLNRTDDTAWAYRQLKQYQTSTSQETIIEAYALIAKGKAKQAINTVTGLFNSVSGTNTEKLQKRIIRNKAYFLQGEFKQAAKEIERIFDLLEKVDDVNEIDDIQNKIYTFFIQTAYELAFKVLDGLELAIELLNKIYDTKFEEETSVTNPHIYYFYMAYMFVFVRQNKWESVLKYSKETMSAAHFAYGVNSYQYERARLIRNYAYKKAYGKFYISDNPRENVRSAFKYQRIYDAINCDKSVKSIIDKENLIFDNLAKELNP